MVYSYIQSRPLKARTVKYWISLLTLFNIINIFIYESNLFSITLKFHIPDSILETEAQHIWKTLWLFIRYISCLFSRNLFEFLHHHPILDWKRWNDNKAARQFLWQRVKLHHPNPSPLPHHISEVGPNQKIVETL